jgi:hypothetical protein
VHNLGYAKDVALHYRYAGSDEWREFTLTWLAWLGDHDIFTSPSPGYLRPLATDFVIRYSVNGRTYWYNNYGLNYRLGTLEHGSRWKRWARTRADELPNEWLT